MYCNQNQNNNNNVAGQMGGRCNWNVLPDMGRRRCNCDFVYECLLELLAGDTGRGNRCNCVYECLYELLSDALEENDNDNGNDNGNGNGNCHHHCGCPR